MTAKLLSAILQLSNSSFGENYLTSEELKEFLNASNTKVIIEIDDDELKGFSIVQILDLAQLKTALFIDDNLLNEYFSNLDYVGYRKMTAVDPKSKGQGIAQSLFQKGQEWISKRSHITVSANWVQREAPSFDPILQKNGFKQLIEIENYWEEDSLLRQFICPVCGKPPCKCNAAIYAKFEK